jgi:hypothetical protein
MNHRLIAAAALAVFAAAASAQEAVYEPPQAVASTMTRAAVMADLERARADGTLEVTEADRNAWPAFTATRSRDAVRAETLAAARSGELQALHREDNSFDGRITATARVASGGLIAAAQ